MTTRKIFLLPLYLGHLPNWDSLPGPLGGPITEVRLYMNWIPKRDEFSIPKRSILDLVSSIADLLFFISVLLLLHWCVTMTPCHVPFLQHHGQLWHWLDRLLWNLQIQLPPRCAILMLPEAAAALQQATKAFLMQGSQLVVKYLRHQYALKESAQ